jgi:hypothetical protein
VGKVAIDPSKYQDFISKKITYEQAQMPTKPGAANTVYMPQAASTSNAPSAPAGGGYSTPSFGMPPKPATNMPMAYAPPPAQVNAPQLTPSQQSARDWINNSASGQGGYDAYTKQQNDKYQQAVKLGDNSLLDRLQEDAQRVGYSFNSPLSASQASATAWINNQGSGQGGIDAYTAQQNQKYTDAYGAGNQEMLAKINADAQRVGYTINMPQQQPKNTAVQTTGGVSIPAETNNRAYNVGTNADREAEAARQYSLALADKRRIADQQKNGLLSTYGKLRTNINEDRTLQDYNFQQTHNPFSGKTSYDKGITNMQRERSDREMSQDLASRSANIDEMLAGYENATVEEKQRIVDQLTRADRDFGVQQGQLTGNYNNQRTLAGSAQDASFLGTYQGQQTMQAQNQAFNQAMQSKDANWNAYKDAIGFTGNLGSGPKSDWGQLPGQQGPASYPAQQQDIQNTAQYTGYYKGMPTMQKIMQDNTIRNMTADNARAAASEARSAGNQSLASKFDVWDRTGKAPAGIPGVPVDTPLVSKSSSATPKPTQIDPKESADNYSLILEDLDTPGLTKAQALALVQANKDYLSDADYKAAINEANKF